MQMKKYMLIFIYIFVLMLFPCHTSAKSQPMSGTCGANVTWTLDSAGTLTIRGTGKMDDFYQAQGGEHMPSWYEEHRDDIKSVRIENSVTRIGDYSFKDCGNLRTVTIADSVVSIGSCAFWGCRSLVDVSIPDGVISIGDMAFSDCRSLAGVTIPDSVTSIGDMAFSECGSLVSMSIPDGLASIEFAVFNGCKSLAEIKIPRSVKKIDCAFHYCDNLKNVYYEGSESEWDTIDVVRLYNRYHDSCNGDLVNADFHYDSKWNFSLFQTPSTKYNNRLAMAAAEMSEKAEAGEAAIRSLYDSYGLSECKCEHFGLNESAAFAIGQDTMVVDGVNTTLLVITARGSTSLWEFIGDLFKGKEDDFLGTKVWHNVKEFYETIQKGVRDYIKDHPDLKTKKHLKVLVNGHSLGGAAANMFGAMLTSQDGMNGEIPLGMIKKENIYVYTFGAIKVLTEENKDNNISKGYENIHNIYNYYDSFGPNGNWKDQNASAIKAKFGHTEVYYLQDTETGLAIWDRTSNNHLMSNYKRALEEKKVVCAKEDAIAQRTRLVSEVQARTSDTVNEVFYSDYDGDGEKEAFICTENTESGFSLWFSGKQTVKKLISTQSEFLFDDGSGICEISKKQKLFVADLYAGGSGSTSCCYYVKNGKPVKVKEAGSGLKHIKGKDFTIVQHAFDSRFVDGHGEGHTRKIYYVKWNGKEFVEYAGKRMTQKELQKYKGAKSILTKAKNLGYEIGEIYYRKNGIINVNLTKGDMYSVEQDNLTFVVNGNKVFLKICNKDGKNVVEQSSYGGVYSAKILS